MKADSIPLRISFISLVQNPWCFPRMSCHVRIFRLPCLLCMLCSWVKHQRPGLYQLHKGRKSECPQSHQWSSASMFQVHKPWAQVKNCGWRLKLSFFRVNQRAGVRDLWSQSVMDVCNPTRLEQRFFEPLIMWSPTKLKAEILGWKTEDSGVQPMVRSCFTP